MRERRCQPGDVGQGLGVTFSISSWLLAPLGSRPDCYLSPRSAPPSLISCPLVIIDVGFYFLAFSKPVTWLYITIWLVLLFIIFIINYNEVYFSKMIIYVCYCCFSRTNYHYYNWNATVFGWIVTYIGGCIDKDIFYHHPLLVTCLHLILNLFLCISTQTKRSVQHKLKFPFWI